MEFNAMSIAQAEAPLYVDGSWRTASGPAIDVYDPRNEKVLAAPGPGDPPQAGANSFAPPLT